MKIQAHGRRFVMHTKSLTLATGITIVLAAMMMIIGCNSGQQPADTALNLTPSNRSFEIVQQVNEQNQCLFNPDFYQDVPLLFSLASGQGTPIGEADIAVYVDFSANTYSGLPVLELYEDNNNNGVVDDESELVTGIDDPAFHMRTEQYSGEHLMFLRINLSCPYRGQVFAYSGSASASMLVDVSVRETVIVSGY
jgi:hypothetical protein